MSIPVPLAVRVQSARDDRKITRELENLRFRSSSPGGFESATFTVHRRLKRWAQDLDHFAKVTISDKRSGREVWSGRIEDPGRSADGDGETFQITAAGPKAYASDRTIPLIYIDRSLDGWSRGRFCHKSADVSKGETSAGTDTLDVAIPEGTSMNDVGDQVEWQYTALYDAGMLLGRYHVNCDNGVDTSNLENRLYGRVDPAGSGTLLDNVALSQAGSDELLGRRGNEFTTNLAVISLRIYRVTAAASTGSGVWGEYRGGVVRGVLKDRNGSNLTSSSTYAFNTVLASEIVEDLLGRLLDQYDADTASVATTSYAIRHLAFPEGATAAQVLDELLTLEPGYTWGAWERMPDTGLHRFEFGLWPTTPRYEAVHRHGFDGPSSGADLYNEAIVQWIDAKERRRSVTGTSTVPELDDAGLTRTAVIQLDQRSGVDSSQASQAATAFLQDHKHPPNRGGIRIPVTVMDLQQGWKVDPWWIRPGNVIRVRGVESSIGQLNANERDGSSICRITAVDFDAASATATLELDDYPWTMAREIYEARKAHRRRKLPPGRGA